MLNALWCFKQGGITYSLLQKLFKDCALTQFVPTQFSTSFYPRASTATMNVSAAFVKDLEDIDGSVESISSLSAYMRMHSASAERVVAVRWTRAAGAPRGARRFCVGQYQLLGLHDAPI